MDSSDRHMSPQLLHGDQEHIPECIECESVEVSHSYDGIICVMIDAAYATALRRSAVLGQAVEDALINQAALGQRRKLEDVPVFFRTFGASMTPQGQSVIESENGDRPVRHGRVELRTYAQKKATCTRFISPMEDQRSWVGRCRCSEGFENTTDR